MPNHSMTQDGKHFLVKAQASVKNTVSKLASPPMMPMDGPPLPQSLKIQWPWKK